ncbi:MAG: ribosome biogenesis GTPase Der [Christensenellaceae bacterium]
MAKPLVAIVGRPNVGKSTLFNKICKRRIAIIEDTPGVTRDRIFQDAEWLGYQFVLVDTGGIEPESEDIILAQMRRQAEMAMEAADVILFLTDAKAGLVSADYEVADMLRRTDKPVVLAVNKVENKHDQESVYDFYNLGIGAVHEISAEQSLGLGDLLDEIVSYFDRVQEPEEDATYIAIVGKPNVGKSSLANKILGQQRSIVSDIPGTTRDAIDTPFYRDGKKYILTDTAGMRKKGKIERDSVERYSVIRSLAAVRRADIVLTLIDAEQGITEQDVKIAGYVDEEGKPSIIVVNKWDAVEKDTYTIEKYKKDIEVDLAFMTYAPQIYISAKTGQRVDKLFPLMEQCLENANRRISTGLLNDCIREAIAAAEPPTSGGRRLRIYYATQVSTCPPTFVLFVNDVKLMHYSYERYLKNYLRKTFDFSGTPIRMMVRNRNENRND